MSRPAPPPGPRRVFEFPRIDRVELANGLQVLAVPTNGTPLVSIRLLVDAGGQHGPRDGLPALHASLLDEGTERHSSLEIATELERLGGSLGSGAGWDAASVSVRSLSRHLEHSLTLLSEVAQSPTFPDAEIERERDRRQAEILRLQHEPSAIAGDILSRTIFAGTPYELPLIGTSESLAQISRHDLLRFYRENFGGNRSALIAVGDFELSDALIGQVEDLFGDWSSPTHPDLAFEPLEIDPPTIPGVKVYIADRPGGAQTQLLLGHVGVPRNFPDFPALRLLNAMLGGKFISRINLNLRERNGYTYGAHSSFSCRRGAGAFTVSTAVANNVAGAASREILAEIEGIRAGSPPESELADAREYLIGVFPYTVQTIADIAGRLEDLAVYRLPRNTFAEWTNDLDRVTADDIGELARRVLQPDRMVIVAVGPADELKPQLADLGEVTIVDAP